MTTESEQPRPRADGRWSPNNRMAYTGRPEGALVANVDDRALTSPLQGFGKLWRKQYRVSLAGTTLAPEDVMATWKAEFPTFWPPLARFYGASDHIQVGDSALINLGLGRMTLLSTGILVLFEDDRSFTFMTPEGHAFAAWITFSSDVVDGVPFAQIEVLIRASDPLFELLMALGFKWGEDWQWRIVLRNLAARVDAQPHRPVITRECVDHRRQWQYARNIRANSGLRTVAHLVRHIRPRRSTPFTRS